MDNKEIELKFVITKEIRKKIINDLEKVCSKPLTQQLVDTYYEPDFRHFEVNGQTNECVRIRECKNQVVLAYKKIHREASPVYCDEYETIVLDKTQTENILFALGFNIQMVIDKTRVSYKLDNFEFDFDSVKDLGELLEIELKDENASLNDIYNFVSKYGLSKKDVTYDGIQVLMKKTMQLKNHHN